MKLWAIKLLSGLFLILSASILGCESDDAPTATPINLTPEPTATLSPTAPPPLGSGDNNPERWPYSRASLAGSDNAISLEDGLNALALLEDSSVVRRAVETLAIRFEAIANSDVELFFSTCGFLDGPSRATREELEKMWPVAPVTSRAEKIRLNALVPANGGQTALLEYDLYDGSRFVSTEIARIGVFDDTGSFATCF